MGCWQCKKRKRRESFQFPTSDFRFPTSDFGCFLYHTQMHVKSRLNVLASSLAVVFDALAVFCGILLATWFRFETGLVHWLHARLPLIRERFPLIEAPPVLSVYVGGAFVATVLLVWIFHSFELYKRPQTGTFGDKVPRLCRASGLGFLIAMALAFTLKNRAPISTPVAVFSAGAVTVLLLIERYVLFRLEITLARRAGNPGRVLVIGADTLGADLMRALEREPRLNARVTGFIRTPNTKVDPSIPEPMLRGTVEDLPHLLENREADQLVLADTSLGHVQMVRIIMMCERNLITFSLVPDLFRLLTSTMDMRFVEGIPLLGTRAWPLDSYWNQALKRVEDIVGALVGLVLTAPLLGVLGLLVRRTSPGPALFRQERCGRSGKAFTLYKLRTMRADAEQESGPVWTTEDDPRRTRIGAFLRRTNLDELPQLWNVLKGEMSLVGPRPERPHFVEQFKEDIGRYMWRHVSKPGITGWAQVHGYRGNTSIEKRVQYDLFYLENWSLALDFKILARTLFARKNAY